MSRRTLITWLGLALCSATGGMAVGSNAAAESGSSREYEIKTAFIYNFVKFVDWPAAALPETSDTLNLCVWGDEPFAVAFDSLKDKVVKGRRLVVKHMEQPRDFEGCHVLFVGSSEEKRAQQVMQALQGRSILTVGETERFPQLGGIINFVIEKNKIRFEINMSSAERASLKLSSQLLSLAKIVRQ